MSEQQATQSLEDQVRAIAASGDLEAIRALESLLQQLRPKTPPPPPLLHAIFGPVELGVILSDFNGDPIYINPAFLSWLGYTQEELSKQRLGQQTHPEDLTHNASLFQQLTDGTRDHIVYEKRYHTKRGELIWVRLNVSVCHLLEQPLLLAFVQDITPHKDAILAQEQAFYNLAESLPYNVWSVSQTGQVDYVTHVMLAYSGMPREAFMGDDWGDFVHPDDRHSARMVWLKSHQDKSPYQLEMRLRRHDGDYRWHLVHTVPLYDAHGEIKRWYGTANDIHDLRTLEHESKRLSARMAHTFENMNEGVCILDHQQRYIFVNSQAEQHMGKTRAQMLGRTRYEVFPGLEDTSFARVFDEATTQRRPAHIEDYLHTLNKWFSIHIYPCEEGMIFFALDVSQKHRTQAQLATLEARSRLAANATSDAIWDWDLSTNSIWWSQSIETIFGIPQADLIDGVVYWSDRIHPEDQQRIIDSIQAAFKSDQESWRDEYRLQRGDRSYAWVTARGFITRDEQGDVTRMIGGISDETERVESTIRLSEQANLLDRAQDAILVRSLDHHIIYANKSAERIYGWSQDELMGAPIRTLFYQDPAMFDDATAQVLKLGEWHGELEHKRRDGALINVEARWSLVRDTKERPLHILAIHTDITERKKLHAQLLRAQRLESIGTLAGGIAHDLNNVLTPIMLSLETLRSHTPPERLDLLETIASSAQHGADLVRQVLTFARGVEGRRLAVSLPNILEDLRGVIRDTFPKSITFHTQTSDNIWPILGDHTQVYQVLLNLCLNARDAMPAGGSLRIIAENIVFDEQYAAQHRHTSVGPHIKIAVIDEGEGIPADLLSQIFDPFFTTKSTGHGTGLGLSTVASIMRSHRGSFNVYSEPRRGSNFTLYFCAADDQTMTHRASQKLDASLYGSQELILVVDDDEPVRKITQQTLESFGYRVITACDGADAIDLHSQHGLQIDLIITDITMPIMSGPETIHALLHLNPKAKIIAASGLGDAATIAQATKAGGRSFLHKPYTAPTLLRAIKEVLEQD